MQFRIPLFLWVSGLITGLAFLLSGFLLPRLMEFSPGSALIPSRMSQAEADYILHCWPRGLKTLGAVMLIGSSLLFLMRKKLSNRAYTGIFAGILLLSLLLATAVSMYCFSFS